MVGAIIPVSKLRELQQAQKTRQQIHLFQCNEKSMRLIALKIEHKDVDFTTKEGFEWLRNNLLSDSIEFFNAKKDYSDDKHLDLFLLRLQCVVGYHL